MKTFHRKSAALVLAVALSVSGCATSPGSSGAMGGLGKQNLLVSCAGFAAGAGVLMELYDRSRGKPASGAAQRSQLLKAAAVGCAIGMAATAVGRLLDARQQAQYEEAAQRTAKRQAQEAANYSAVERRYDTMSPARSPKEREDRERRRQDELNKITERGARPETVELAGGGTTTITPSAPGTASPDAPGCFTQTVLVNKPGGQAKQIDTMCPNGKGGFARVESAEGDATG